MSTFDLSAYARRLGITDPLQPDLYTLEQIHRQQVRTIPFENLDILLGRTIALEPEALQSKLVQKQRGGYCFELNGLLYEALTAVGFEVRRVLARVMYNRSEPGARTHLAMIVKVHGVEYLADVGFGGPGLVSPLALTLDTPQLQEGGVFRLISDATYGTVLQREVGEKWMSLYAFQPEVVYPVDLQLSNHFTSTHPLSIFTQRIICTRPNANGRATLSERSLHVVTGTEQSWKEITNAAEFHVALEEYFGIRDPDLRQLSMHLLTDSQRRCD